MLFTRLLSQDHTFHRLFAWGGRSSSRCFQGARSLNSFWILLFLSEVSEEQLMLSMESALEIQIHLLRSGINRFYLWLTFRYCKQKLKREVKLTFRSRALLHCLQIRTACCIRVVLDWSCSVESNRPIDELFMPERADAPLRHSSNLLVWSAGWLSIDSHWVPCSRSDSTKHWQ